MSHKMKLITPKCNNKANESQNATNNTTLQQQTNELQNVTNDTTL